MNKSMRLFTVKGIDIRVHFTFPFILIWAALQFGQIYGGISGMVFGVVAITLLFILVTLHELGHSYAARRYGIPVKQIVLSPIGGVAQLQRMPDKPSQELVIAIAGPAVNVAMALVLGALALLSGVSPTNLIGGISGAEGATLAALLSYIFVSNLFLAIFNLIPAFPMDGGRVFRALLAMRMNYASATRIAANVGRGVAVLMGLYGLFNGGIFMIFIALFIFTAAGREADYAQVKDSLGGYTVQQTYSPTAYRLSPSSTLQQAQNMSAYTGQREFAIVDGGQLVGYLNAQQLRSAMAAYPAYEPVRTFMSRNVSPVTPTTDLFETQQLMVQAQTEALPVVNLANQYLGLVTRQHISEFFQMVQSSPPIIHGQSSA